ncbi:tyrosine--tRNA ligase [Pelotomaculum isophthalicicum JI]|uniref:Tyrosine--tRNA ligase n=1 Tax=Pelotomaculum isophthalicicum JI TaxID=947010 RepID=A0A9X4H069_9FIRM|nr:tyrosine--tRNA ligase [Pelotomaculum isophthalicicum]MDF9409577.1 tyrosine--tRNA ligase [Pelotomaculum isophthalicicum JI]
MGSVYDTLLERGYIKQMTHEEPLINLLKNEKVTFYIGFDPTADSLHVGHFLQLMVMSYMQKAGHRPIALIGGGTAMVGDPSGKTDMRKMMTPETIRHNSECFKKQLSRFIDFNEERAIMVDNGEWLLRLNYIDFLREIGVYFSVNRMLTAESYKNRLERGLTFLEFNYQLMQAYDFLELYRKYNCVIQLGGDDQWSNILAGTDLIRRKAGVEAYGLTFTLLTTSEGKKMGKTETGALWLDAEKTSPYEFYQYWRNINDPDVENCLALLTFLPMEEVKRLGSLPGEQINEAKKVLAYEVTKLIHGEDEAVKARSAAESLFGAGDNFENVPTTTLNREHVSGGTGILDLMLLAGLISSKGEGRRLIAQGGVSVNGNKVDDMFLMLKEKDFVDGKMMIKKGKKVYHQFIVK